MSTTEERRFRNVAVLWFGFLVVAYVTADAYMTSALLADKEQASLRHETRFDPELTEPGKTAAETRAVDLDREPESIVVESGIYLDRVFDISIRDSRWGADFYIWFRWTDGKGHPGENFQVVDGVIRSKSLDKSFQDGDTHYELYRVTAEITKFFSAVRFPRDDHLLTIKVEDSKHQKHDLRFVPDVAGSDLSSRARIPGYEVYRTDLVVKDHSYKTRRGDPRLPEDYKANYSQLIYGVWIKRPGWGLYVKLFLGTFASASIALLVFFISPEHAGPRFGVGVGSFFAGVASNYVISRQIPQTSTIGLPDFVTGVVLVTIFLTLLSSVISVRFHGTLGRPELIRRFDMAAFALFLAGIATLMVTLALSASI